jgi:hypothetical protein
VREEGALFRAPEWINASKFVNTADSNCKATPESCIDKIRKLQKTVSPATGEEYGVDEEGFRQLLKDRAIDQAHSAKLSPLSSQDMALINAHRREKEQRQKLKKLLQEYESNGHNSESLYHNLKQHVNKCKDHSLSADEAIITTDLIKILFQGASGHNRATLLHDLAAELAESTCPSEKETGSLLKNTLEGVRALKERDLPDIITPLVESAATNTNRWFRWPIMPWCIDDWLRRMNATSSHGYVSHPNGIWRQYSRCLYNLIGGGNGWLLIAGPRHKVGFPLDLCSCIHVFALPFPVRK